MKYSYRVEQAIKASVVLHKDQIRKGSVALPYITHIFAVAMLVSDYTDDEATIVASLLHDTLEDTDYTEAELLEDFGEDVLKLVKAISEPKSSTDQNASWLSKKSAYIESLMTAPQEALLIVAADKIHNFRSIIEEYYDNYDKFYRDFKQPLEDRERIYKEISEILNRRLDNAIMSEYNLVYQEYVNFIEDAKSKSV